MLGVIPNEADVLTNLFLPHGLLLRCNSQTNLPGCIIS